MAQQSPKPEKRRALSQPGKTRLKKKTKKEQPPSGEGPLGLALMLCSKHSTVCLKLFSFQTSGASYSFLGKTASVHLYQREPEARDPDSSLPDGPTP